MPRSTSTVALRSDRTFAPRARIAGARPPRRSLRGDLAATWGVAGQVAVVAAPSVLLLRAALRGLAPGDAGPGHWALASALMIALGYFQGYRGFQRRYAPFVAARAAHLARHPTVLHGLAAPLYVSGLVGATRGRRAKTALLFTVMPLLAVAVGRLPAPYRALVDLGVAFGLAWGAVALAGHGLRAALGAAPALPLDLPGSR